MGGRFMGLWNRGLQVRARRALDRQLAYQRRKATQVKGREEEVISWMVTHSQEVRRVLDGVRAIPADARVLEVGCGAHGLIFFFGTENGLGLDPLAHHYATMFPAWQGRARTVTAVGECLPLRDQSFDIVLCDNVVDHAEDPRRIIEEIARVLVPGGVLYFEVNIHHPFYKAVASLHAAWRALGVKLEIAPFADHTVHLTLESARALFKGLPLRLVREMNDVEQAKRHAGQTIRHVGDRLKRLFFKNARYELVAVREPVT
jgi:SAM-dependent methyltransferase